MLPYNRANYNLCKREAVGFTYSLAHESHLDDDRYHLNYRYRHYIAKSVAAALVDIDTHVAYNTPRTKYRPT